jgi:hypothetical protein
MMICLVDERGGGLGSRVIEELRGMAAEPCGDWPPPQSGVSLGDGTSRRHLDRNHSADGSSSVRWRGSNRGVIESLDAGSMLGEVTPVLVPGVLESLGKERASSHQQTERRSGRHRWKNPRCVDRPCRAADRQSSQADNLSGAVCYCPYSSSQITKV